MADREKVINDLQDAVNDDWMWQHADFYALTMQKAISLLQEQEPVEPIEERLNDIDCIYRCGNCKTHFYYRQQKYCAICGRMAKWK